MSDPTLAAEETRCGRCGVIHYTKWSDTPLEGLKRCLEAINALAPEEVAVADKRLPQVLLAMIEVLVGTIGRELSALKKQVVKIEEILDQTHRPVESPMGISSQAAIGDRGATADAADFE